MNISKTLTILWYDEYGFLPYNSIIYMNAAPAYKTASMNAKRNGAPYGILLTTTPGFMSTDKTLSILYSDIESKSILIAGKY